TSAPAASSTPIAPPPTPVAPPPTPALVRAPLFKVDPVADGALILSTAAFAGLLDFINSTGELRPQQIASTFDRAHLLGIDRGAASQTVDKSARMRSNIGVAAAGAYALIDAVLSGFRDESVQTGIVDGVLYAESATITWGVTNLTKIAIRRPRPQA